jgi:hypothetical protein
LVAIMILAAQTKQFPLTSYRHSPLTVSLPDPNPHVLPSTCVICTKSQVLEGSFISDPVSCCYATGTYEYNKYSNVPSFFIHKELIIICLYSFIFSCSKYSESCLACAYALSLSLSLSASYLRYICAFVPVWVLVCKWILTCPLSASNNSVQ